MAGKVFLDKFKVGLIVAVNSLAGPTYGSKNVSSNCHGVPPFFDGVPPFFDDTHWVW